MQDYKEHHDNLNVHFIVSMSAKDLEKAEAQGLLEFFKLTSKLNTSNMICFDFEGKIKKYDTAEEILEDFYPVRLAYYQKRKVMLSCNYSVTDLAKNMRAGRTSSRMNCRRHSRNIRTRRGLSR